MKEAGLYEGRWWHPLEDGRIQCDLCPRTCRLREGQRAFCFVRQNREGRMVLTTWGRSTGFCLDPIEKKPLNHFFPGTSVLSFGTAGCNLGCRFCQNWDISKAREIERLSDLAEPSAIAEAAQRAGSRSVAFTYNDPVIWAEYAIEAARACHDLGISTVAVTAGYITAKARREFFSAMDAVNIDLKAFSEQFYQKLCFGHLEPVLDTLRFLRHETDVWFEVTTLLIPGQNDSADELSRMFDWYAENLGPSVPLHLTAFHPDFKMLEIQRTSEALLKSARKKARGAGLHHVYTGNVHDESGQSTYCAQCGDPVIQRNWYRLGAYRLDHRGRCKSCGSPMAGRFSGREGDWGGRRERVAV